jgi:hypothetical protein
LLNLYGKDRSLFDSMGVAAPAESAPSVGRGDLCPVAALYTNNWRIAQADQRVKRGRTSRKDAKSAKKKKAGPA